MELLTAIMIVLLAYIGIYSLHGISVHLPKRRKYSYLHDDDINYNIPLRVLIYFWIFVLSNIIIICIVYNFHNT
jgi:hypothetical protein